jgi:hypothetical protein
MRGVLVAVIGVVIIAQVVGGNALERLGLVSASS